MTGRGQSRIAPTASASALPIADRPGVPTDVIIDLGVIAAVAISALALGSLTLRRRTR